MPGLQRLPGVVLFPDTFNNYFQPEVAEAGLEVLEAAGFEVLVPSFPVCCGRPLYDYGMLEAAKERLRDVMAKLRPQLRAGLPIVVLEPSCAAVFRDELPALFPDDQDARRLRDQTFLLSELLQEKAASLQLPRLERRALVQRHCHQQSVLGFEAEEQVLERLGIVAEVPDSGCCGMAGAFGFEKEHYPVAQACGERVILPRVRAADEQTLVLADGFSCRTQISQSTARRPMHLAQAIQLAMDQAPSRTERVMELRALARRARRPRVGWLITAAVALLAGGVFLRQARSGAGR